jgi:hypothetical protein
MTWVPIDHRNVLNARRAGVVCDLGKVELRAFRMRVASLVCC